MVKVLIADDHLEVRKLLQVTLEKNGYEVMVVKNGQQAWQILNQEGDVQLAILDWILPEMDGVEVCRKLQTEHKSSLFYVILLIAPESTDKIAAALQAGANDYVIKPFENDELLARLKVGERIIDLQKELTQAQKLESIGQLASGIAHEINTPIQYIGDNIRFMQEAFQDLKKLLTQYDKLANQIQKANFPSDMILELESLIQEIDLEYLNEEVPQAIRQSIQGVEHVTKIVRAMKEFAHPGVADKTHVDMNRTIESTITIATNKWKYYATIETDFDPELPPVYCMAAEINQVILNLIVNAADAISEAAKDVSQDKGTITVRTRRRGQWAEIRVADTGPGISDEIRDKIFNPFFTTKEVGKGSGQGLAICRSIIVEKHGGTISFETEVGKGTNFTIRLPLKSSGGDTDIEANYATGKTNPFCG